MDKTVIGFLKNSKVASTVKTTVFFLLRVAPKSRLYFSNGKKTSKSMPNKKKKEGKKRSTSSC